MSRVKMSDEIITIPHSPNASGKTASPNSGLLGQLPATPTPSETSSGSSVDLLTNNDTIKQITSNLKDRRRHIEKRMKSCREKTLESEICRTINKYVTRMMSDDNCRRITALVIIVFAIIGLWHVLALLFGR